MNVTNNKTKKQNIIGVIADIHNKVEKAENIIEELEKDEDISSIVLLGDYFDDFNDSPAIAKKTAMWLKNSLCKPKRIHLLGNHDLPYFYPWNQHIGCPGWEIEKQIQISKVLNKEDVKKFKSHHLIQPEQSSKPNINATLLSHAGITVSSLYGVLNPTDTKDKGRLHFLNDIPTQEHLAKFETDAQQWLKLLEMGEFHPLMAQGTRVGQNYHGGPQWLDWSNFEPIANINQIVGHTIVKTPETKAHSNSKNYCVDTNLNHFFLLNTNSGILEGYTIGDAIDSKKYRILWEDVTKKSQKVKAIWLPNRNQNIEPSLQ